MLEEILKKEIEVKYNIDFKELKDISDFIRKNTYDQNKLSVYILMERLIDNTYTSKCIQRYKVLEKREFSYISDLDLYKRIEKGYKLFYLLLDYMNLDILWNKEVNNVFDNDYKVLKRIVDIYLMETDDLVKDIEKYELGGCYENEKDTDENLCCYKRKV